MKAILLYALSALFVSDVVGGVLAGGVGLGGFGGFGGFGAPAFGLGGGFGGSPYGNPYSNCFFNPALCQQ